MSFPSTIDAPAGTAAQGTSLLSVVDHGLDHRTLGSAVIAIENKVGIGVGSANTNLILVGTANGTSNWQQTWNNGTLGTPAITGGTMVNGNFNNGTIGTPTTQQGTLLQPFMDTHSIGSAAWLG